MNLTAKKISDLIGGKIIGNSNEKINNIAKIEEGKKGDLCFLSNPKYSHYIYSSNASVIIINNNFLPKEKINCTLIKVKDPYLSFTKLLSIYKTISFTEVGISKKADINQNTKIGENVFIGSFSTISSNVTLKKNVKIMSNCFIGNNVTIGKNTIIFPGVTIYNNCIIGANSLITENKMPNIKPILHIEFGSQKYLISSIDKVRSIEMSIHPNTIVRWLLDLKRREVWE